MELFNCDIMDYFILVAEGNKIHFVSNLGFLKQLFIRQNVFLLHVFFSETMASTASEGYYLKRIDSDSLGNLCCLML